ncbi:chemotaxis protein CheW [Enterovibrio norvegicus]|uniref:chemotaxis protein CheW n=1 Tax=Enterovibrio norvegicus TaxID=188144 RepID=UPI0024B20F57|nr:chemotaxis protein CheW [Enterovibrio norvegicus]
MKDSGALSSVEALDAYFDALLEDDDSLQQEQEEVVQPDNMYLDADFSEAPAPALKLQEVTSPERFTGRTLTQEERDLSHVEKLLSQLKLDEDMEVEVEELTDVELASELETDIETVTDAAAAVEAYTEALTETVDDIAEVTPAVSLHLVSDTDTDLDTEMNTDIELDVESGVDTSVLEEAALQEETALQEDTTLLEEVEVQQDIESATVTPLHVDTDVDVETNVTEEAYVESDVETDIAIDTDVDSELDTQACEDLIPPWQNIVPEHAFQVLFFESMGVTYAVPLAELGGIHQLGECNHLIGRPDWYLGLQTERDQQLDIVDTAKWVMPEKITDNSHRDDYSYIVILGDSKWGLACNTLLGTESLNGEQVRWREQAGKRPWLAGLVKQKMCALIHVEALIAMLNQGIDANALA